MCEIIDDIMRALAGDLLKKGMENGRFKRLKPGCCNEIDCGKASDLVAVQLGFDKFHPGTSTAFNKKHQYVMHVLSRTTSRS